MASLLERWGIATAAAGSSGAVDGASPWATLTILKQGWFRAQLLDGTEGRACMVAVVPVIWFVKTPGHPLRTTGLGDVTSALSFYFGDYLVDQQAPKRGCVRSPPEKVPACCGTPLIPLRATRSPGPTSMRPRWQQLCGGMSSSGTA